MMTMFRPPPTLAKIMKAPLVFVGVDTLAGQARELAAARGMHHLPVCHGDDLAGTICSCDLHRVPHDVPVGNLMRRDVLTLPHTASAEDAAQLMQREGRGSVVVLENGGPCGMVTRGDVGEWGWDWDADAVSAEPRCQCCGLCERTFRLEDGRILCSSCLHGRSMGNPSATGANAPAPRITG
jgi:CBS-domain-containing membrane protein